MRQINSKNDKDRAALRRRGLNTTVENEGTLPRDCARLSLNVRHTAPRADECLAIVQVTAEDPSRPAGLSRCTHERNEAIPSTDTPEDGEVSPSEPMVPVGLFRISARVEGQSDSRSSPLR